MLKKAVIIGGGSGIGASISSALAEREYELVIHTGHKSEKYDALIERLQKKTKVYPVIELFPQGMDSYKIFSVLENSVLSNYIVDADILIVCYGPFFQCSLHNMNTEDWYNILNSNLLLPGLLVSKVLPSMMNKKWGRILLFGGTRTDTIQGYKTNPAYGAAKTAVCSLVKSVAIEYANYGITCNAILPGFVDTESITDEQRLYYTNSIPLKKMITKESIAETAMMLIENEDINGALLKIDRGWTP